MKKLMIALAAAATTMFSFGAETETAGNRDTLVNGATGTSFEALTEGSKTVGDIVDKDDEGATVGDYYWYSTASATDELGAITNDVASGVSRPDLFANQNQANTKSLQIDTTAPLVRTALPNAGASEVSPVDIGDGIYLDTLVKFTAAEEGFTTNSLTAGDKIAIEYVEHGADALNEAEPDTYTNFVIRAGLIGEELGQTNYYAYVSGDPDFTNFDKDAWHRLTVRTIADVGDGNVGFVIYLDGDVNKTLEYPTTVDAGFGTLSAVAAKFYNPEKHALFPSAILAEDIGGSTISSVAFSGNGFIDDVSFAAEAPQFIKAGEAVVATFVADAGVTAISVSVAGVADPILVDMTADTLSAQLPAQTTAFTVDVTVDEANGYKLGSISYGGTPVVDGEVTGYAGGDITVTTIRNNFNLFDENGDPIQGTFQKLSEALAAQNVAKIVLAHSYNVAENEGNEFVTYNIDSDITLNLNGNTITGGGDDALFTVGSGVTMIVIDSSAANTGKIDYTGTYAVFYSEGDVVIGATTGDYGPTIDGYLAAADDGGDGVWLVKGKIEAATNSGEGAFLWDGYLGDPDATITSDADLDSDEEYWVVTPQSGPTTTFALTTTGGANATITTDPAAVSALTEETEVTITSTPATGYTYNGVDLTDTGFTYDSESGTISRTLIVTTDTEVAVPGAVAQQLGTYTVTVTPTANATYAAAYKVGGETITPANDVLTVTVGQTIVITATPAEGYEYAETPTDWTAGQDGEITIEVSEAGTVAIPAPTEKGGKTYPSYIDDAEEKTKYDTWAAYAEISAADFPDATGSNQEAYLLNCKPSEVADAKAAFKFTAFDQANPKDTTKTTTTTSYNGRDYNGTVVIKQYSDVGCTTESATGTFFRAVLQ